MSITDARKVTDLLLASIYYDRGPQRSPHSFIYNRPGQPAGVSGLGMELNYEDRPIIDAVLHLRRHGAPYLKALSVSDVRSALTNFLSENFWTVSAEAWMGQSVESFATFISDAAAQRMANEMAKSKLFVEPSELTLFPLSVVKCTQLFAAGKFFFAPPESLTPALLQSPARPAEVRGEQFPPFSRSGWTKQPVAAWLGVWAPNDETARRMRAAILGALALLPHPGERYTFSGREITKGRCTLRGNSLTVTPGERHTPPLSEDIVLGPDDMPWLETLSEKVISPRKDDKKKMRALEYFYRSWMPEPARRFPGLFGALDAIFGDAGKATQAVAEAVGPVMGSDYDVARLKCLLSLRASVVHGGSPNVYESSSYHRYYVQYYTDAIRDLELITARCLQATIFEGRLRERPHTYADLLFQKTGRRI